MLFDRNGSRSSLAGKFSLENELKEMLKDNKMLKTSNNINFKKNAELRKDKERLQEANDNLNKKQQELLGVYVSRLGFRVYVFS